MYHFVEDDVYALRASTRPPDEHKLHSQTVSALVVRSFTTVQLLAPNAADQSSFMISSPFTWCPNTEHDACGTRRGHVKVVYRLVPLQATSWYDSVSGQ